MVENLRERPSIPGNHVTDDEALSNNGRWALQVSTKGGQAVIRFKELEGDDAGLYFYFVKFKAGYKDEITVVMEDIEGRETEGIPGWISCTRLVSKLDIAAMELQPFRKDVNIISLGFPGSVPTGKIFTPDDIVNAGVLLRRSFETLHDNTPEMYRLPRTWFADRCIPPGETLMLSRKIVFDTLPDMVSAVVEKKLKEERGKGPARDTGSKQDVVTGKGKGPLKQPKNVPEKEKDPKLGVDSALKRKRDAGGGSPNQLSSAGKSASSEKEKKRPKSAAEREDIEHERRVKISKNFKHASTLPEVDADKLPNKGLAKKVDAKISRTSTQLERLAKEVTFTFDELKSKYILPMDQFIKVPVEMIVAPGEVYGCRDFNESHALRLEDAMTRNVVQLPLVADLLPIRSKDYVDHDDLVPVDLSGMAAEELERVAGNYHYMALSGQHSSFAMQWLRERRAQTKDSHIIQLAERFRYRQCRILVGGLPAAEYRAISAFGNKDPNETEFVTPYVSQVEHLRVLWHSHRCPPRPTSEDTGMSDDYNVSF